MAGYLVENRDEMILYSFFIVFHERSAIVILDIDFDTHTTPPVDNKRSVLSSNAHDVLIIIIK